MKIVAWLGLLLCACVTPPLLTCPDLQVSCGGACVDLDSDPLNCGGCGTRCAGAAATCARGSCVEPCRAPLTDCGAACVDLASDPAHCGACGNACPGAAPMCDRGSCADRCSAPLTDCGGACVDLASDPAHCGACDNACGTDAACVPGPGGPACLCAPEHTGADCSPCRACTGLEFLVAGCTPFSDTQCAPLSVCGPSQYESAPPTPVSDRLCADCSAIPNCLQVACTSGADEVCLQCAPGFDGPLCAPMMMSAAPDCYAILQANLSTGDGLYLVDPDGPGPAPAILTYCDMTNGGWTLLNDQDVNVPPGYQSANAWRAGVSTTGPGDGQWGVLLFAPAFMSAGGDFELRLTFGQDPVKGFVAWRQTGDPGAGMRGAVSAVTMTPAAQASCAGPFAGLADEGSADAAWAGESSCGLAFAVGTSAAVNGGIPAYDSSASGALVTDRVRLWVRMKAL